VPKENPELTQPLRQIRLPALLGMLLTGIALKNLPGVSFDQHWPDYSKVLRGVALVVILLRAGLGLDPVALRRLSGEIAAQM